MLNKNLKSGEKDKAKGFERTNKTETQKTKRIDKKTFECNVLMLFMKQKQRNKRNKQKRKQNKARERNKGRKKEKSKREKETKS